MSPPCKYISHVMTPHLDSGLVYPRLSIVGQFLEVHWVFFLSCTLCFSICLNRLATVSHLLWTWFQTFKVHYLLLVS